MINRKLIRNQVEDYTKVMGAFDAKAMDYNAQVQDAQKGANYLVPYNGGYGISAGAAENGLKLQQNGSDAVMANVVDSLDQVGPSFKPLSNSDESIPTPQYLRNADGTATQVTRTLASTDSMTGAPTYAYNYGQTYKILPDTPQRPDLRAPSLTYEQAQQYNHPTATYPEALRQADSRLIDRNDYHALGDTSKGILQRIMEGKA